MSIWNLNDDDLIKSGIKLAADKNVMVYDVDAKDTLTSKLILLMIDVFYTHYKTYPTQFFTPRAEGFPDLSKFIIIVNHGLFCDGSLTSYFKNELDCTIAPGKKNLCMMSDGKNYLFGSF